MADNNQAAKELIEFAEKLVWKLIREHGLKWHIPRREDAQNDLFVAGWEVWRETGNLGFARKRMSSRAVNLHRDFMTESRHEPKCESSFPKPEEGQPSLLEARRAYTSDPLKAAIWKEAEKRLTERQQQIGLYRSAGLSHQEIANEMGVPLRTIQREWSRIKKELEYVRNQ